jgi:hypothetical protein
MPVHFLFSSDLSDFHGECASNSSSWNFHVLSYLFKNDYSLVPFGFQKLFPFRVFFAMPRVETSKMRAAFAYLVCESILFSISVPYWPRRAALLHLAR